MQVVSKVFVFINNTEKNSPALFFFFFLNLAAVHRRFLKINSQRERLGGRGHGFGF